MGRGQGRRRRGTRRRVQQSPAHNSSSVHSRRSLASAQSQESPTDGAHWPPWMVSDSQRSPFILRRFDVSEDAPLCEPFRFPEGPDRSHVILGTNRSYQDIMQGHHGKTPMRAVVWSARMGLGNSIRGLVHTFLFALLSGRQLLVSTGGPYGASIETLFQAFQGHLDWTSHSVPRVPMYDFRHPNFIDGRPVLQGNPSVWHQGIWYYDLRMRACVMQSLQCTSRWCVHSKILQLFIGSPQAALGDAIVEGLVVAPMLEESQQAQGPTPGPGSGPAQGKAQPGAAQPPSYERRSLDAAAQGKEPGRKAGGGDQKRDPAPAGSGGGGRRLLDNTSPGQEREGVRMEKTEAKLWSMRARRADRLGRAVDEEEKETQGLGGEGKVGGQGAGDKGTNGQGLRGTPAATPDTALAVSASRANAVPPWLRGLGTRAGGSEEGGVLWGASAGAALWDGFHPTKGAPVERGQQWEPLNSTGSSGGGRMEGRSGRGEEREESAAEASRGGEEQALGRAGGAEGRRRELIEVEAQEGVGSGAGGDALRLKFDVAIHVRTFHKCVESYQDIPECHAGGIPHAFEALNTFPELRPFVSIHRWSCISSLLRFLLHLKTRRLQEQGSGFRGMFRRPEDSELLEKYLLKAAHRPGRKPLAAPDPPPEEGATEGEWTLEDAKTMAGTAPGGLAVDEVKVVGGAQAGGPNTSKQGLAIFLATDSEALRPLFVEYLRPFGAVGFSNSSVMHLAHGDSQLPLTRKLVTLGEFYLLSRSSVLVAFNHKNSSYAEMASLYGNTTLLRGVGKSTCNFAAQHVGIPVPAGA